MLRPELPIGSLPAPNALAFLGEQPPPRVWLLSQNACGWQIWIEPPSTEPAKNSVSLNLALSKSMLRMFLNQVLRSGVLA
jgi:hypothetical protein